MTKTVETLIEDVNALLENGDDNIPEEVFEEFGNRMAEMLKSRLATREKRQKGKLRMSNIGSPCFRKTYLQIKYPEEQEKLRADVLLKFLYGDLIEELMLLLATASGHNVQGRQTEYDIEGIKGHTDCVIDGTLLDVKSASSFSFKKFADGDLKHNDPFGYRVQLQSYLHGAQSDPEVVDKDRAAFWVIDKTLGKQCLDFHPKEDWDIPAGYKIRKKQLRSKTLPDRSFDPEAHQKSGNEKLPLFCGYCNMKQKCYEGENLRTFLSSYGPLYLTKVKREPNMLEIDKDGNEITRDRLDVSN